METKEINIKRIILILVLAAAAAIVVLLALQMMQTQAGKQKYTASIESAREKLLAEDYTGAIEEYEAAIAINPQEEDAYLELAELYIEQDDEESAVDILNQGFLATSSAKIRYRLDNVQADYMLAKTDRIGSVQKDAQPVDFSTVSSDLAWNTSFLQKITAYTFQDYKAEFGTVTDMAVDDDGFLEVRHSELPGICYYRNTDENPGIVDTMRNQPSETAMPEKIVLDNISLLFRNFEGAASLQRVQMLLGKNVAVSENEETSYIVGTLEDCTIYLGTDEGGNLTSDTAWNEILLVHANEKEEEEEDTVKMTGVVVDAVTGGTVNGARMVFTCTDRDDVPAVEATTDSDGEFSVSLAPGMYHITVEADGYIADEFDFAAEEGRTYSGEQYVLSPELSGEARIVLEWNAAPRDLDSYLTGTTSSGASAEIDFTNKEWTENGTTILALDLDDTDGYGPETTTIYDLGGRYTFYVHDFLNTGTMAENGATVKIYLPGQDPVTVTLQPDSGVENDWLVCTLDGGVLTVVNTPL